MEDELDKPSERLMRLIKDNLLVVILVCSGLIFLSIGLISLLDKPQPQISFEEGSSQTKNGTLDSKIIIDVEGAVINPGVYSLKTGSRIQDGLIAAGGLSQEADRAYIEKNINLATALTDGQKIYIPKLSDAQKTGVVDGVSMDSSFSSKININSASTSDLDSLSGIGVVTAQKIIDARPYNSIDDLLNRKIVSSKVFEQIKDKISVY